MMQAPADWIVRSQGVWLDAQDCARARALQVARGGERFAGQERQLREGRLTEASRGRIFMIDIKGEDGYLQGHEGKSGGGFVEVEIVAAKLSGVTTLEVAK